MSKFKRLKIRLAETFWVIVREEQTLAPRFSTRVNGWKLFAIGFIVLFGCFVLSLLVVQGINLLLHKDPVSQETVVNKRIIQLMMKVDSLEHNVQQKDAYLVNMQKIIGGDVKPPAPKAAPTPSGTAPTDPATQAQTDSIDAAFRRQFEQQAVEARTQRYAKTDEALKDLTFFAPLGGLIMNRFDVKRKHFAVDIVAKKDEPIKSVADGTVIISSWTQDSGHVIGIQHKNQILSFYKHNSVRLKEVGDVVRAGDIVAIIGNSGELTDGPHLHFELWHNGNPVNPEEYIRFSF